MKCPKCGYVRSAADTAPEWQCPSCGVAYAKVAAIANGGAAAPVRPPQSASSAGKFASFILLVVAIGVGMALSAFVNAPTSKAPLKEYAQANIIMYSLTTCGYCNMKRAELKANGIPFTEHFIDKDKVAQRELFEKLLKSGYTGRGIGTPTFEVNGTMLPNNPSLATIRKHL